MARLSSKSKKEQPSGKGGIIAVCAGVLVIVVLSVTVVALVMKNGKTEPENVVGNETKRNVVVSQDNAEQVVEEMIHQEYIAPGYYSTSMSTTWHFATGDAVSEDAFVENKTENTNDVYFDVFLEEDESTPILQSPVIPRGGELRNIALDTPLDAGTHDCVMVYHLVDEDQNTVSTLRIAFTIIVEH